MRNEDLKVIEGNLEEVRHYSKRAFMKVSEYGLWAMTTWLYYEAKKRGEVTPQVKVLRIIGTLGVTVGCVSDLIYDVRKIIKFRKQEEE